MRFRFKLEKLLHHRKIESDIAQRDYVAAKAKQLEQEIKLEKMKDELQLSIQLRAHLQKKGGAVADEIASVHDFSTGQKVRIGRQERVVKGLSEITEQKRLVLVEAMKQVKTLEKLRENKKADFDREMNVREQKALDELIVMHHGRRRML